jgi:O-methyltransferase
MLTHTVDRVRDLLADNKEEWEGFKSRHPHLWKSLKVAYNAYGQYKFLQYRRIHFMFKDFSMLPPHGYRNNLSLCDTFRTVKGTVVECGVWRGGMIAGIAKLLGPERTYYLYDSFQGLPRATDKDAWPDGYSAISWQADLEKPEFAAIRDRSLNKADISFAYEAMRISGVPNYRIIAGWFSDTLPLYNGGPIAILRMDGDFYESIMDTLNHLYKHVTPGGIIIIDDYYYWQGATRAVHDFLSKNQLVDTIRQHRDGYPYLVKSLNH